MSPDTFHAAARRVTVVVFLILAATPWFIARRDRAAQAEAINAASGGASHGFTLAECAAEAGIDFVHEAPRLDPKVANIEPYIAAFGASVAIVDVDNDGRPDLYVTTSRTGRNNRLYRNNGDGTFSDVAPSAGLADLNRPETGVSMGTVWGDYDNDGDEDMFLYRWGRTALYRNDGDLTFTDVSKSAGFGAWMNANAATWWDFDNDGDLDLYIGGYFPENLDLAHLSTTKILANSFEYATNGGRNHLFENRGGGAFADVTNLLDADCPKWTLAVCAADVNGDGWQDLFLANDYGGDVFLINQRGAGFERLQPGGAAEKPKSGMNAAFGDVRNTGSAALFVTNISKSGYLSQGNNLWTDAAGRWLNIAVPAGVASTGWAWGAQFGDLNNDGWVDLFVAEGFLSANRNADYWYDMAKMAIGTGAVFEDTRNWPAIGGRSLSGYERSTLFLNDRNGGFYDVASSVGVHDLYDGRAVALGDLFGTGALDVVVANQRGPLLIYRNTVAPGRDWIAFDLVGTRSNRDGYGAVVTLGWNDTVQTALLTSASGFSSQNERRVHFGLGPHAKVHRAVIRWPSGAVQTIERPEPNRVHTVVEPGAA